MNDDRVPYRPMRNYIAPAMVDEIKEAARENAPGGIVAMLGAAQGASSFLLKIMSCSRATGCDK